MKMTDIELHEVFFEKLMAEQNQYTRNLKPVIPEQMHPYIPNMQLRQGIIHDMEQRNLSDLNLRIMMYQNCPIYMIRSFLAKNKLDTEEHLHDSISLCIDTVSHETLENAFSEIYIGNVLYAKDHNEIDRFHKSSILNRMCAEQMQEVISTHYRNNRLYDGGAQDIMMMYGDERPALILACNIVQHNENDVRISRQNRSWAEAVLFKWRCDPTQHGDWMMHSVHVGLIDLFAKELRGELALMRENSRVDRHSSECRGPQMFVR